MLAVGAEAWARFRFVEGDIRDLAVCQAACAGVDVVLHQAAMGSVPRSMADPVTTNQVNIDCYVNMLVAARDQRVWRFVYAASSSTYGDSPALANVEVRIGNPLSPYAVTKYFNELYASVFARLRIGDDPTAVLQRCRSASGSRRPVCRRHPALDQHAAARRAVTHQWRRLHDTRFLLRGKRHPGESACRHLRQSRGREPGVRRCRWRTDNTLGPPHGALRRAGARDRRCVAAAATTRVRRLSYRGCPPLPSRHRERARAARLCPDTRVQGRDRGHPWPGTRPTW